MNKKVVIVEDEPPAAKRLQKMLAKIDDQLEVVAWLDSVESAVEYFSTGPKVDLVFLDIQLGDGLSFEIFARVPLKMPIIFTTAYDEYTMQAFKVNSLDYLLKPIESEELEGALKQFESYTDKQKDVNYIAIEELIQSLDHKQYKKRFLIKKGRSLCIVYSKDISYFHSEDGYSHITTSDGTKYIIDHTMDQLGSIMDPAVFYRVNRKLIINIESIVNVSDYFNSRLKLQLSPATKFDAIVARDRVKNFKLWLDSGV